MGSDEIPKESMNKSSTIDEKESFLANNKQNDPIKKQNVSCIRSEYSYHPNPVFCAEGNIKISKEWTAKNGIISNMINEKINDLYFYMDKTTAMQREYSKEIKLENGDKIKIINYDFHEKKEIEEVLYCILKPFEFEECENGKKPTFEWEIKEILNAKDIEQKYGISEDALPESVRMSVDFESML